MKVVCFYDNDPDGFGASWIVHKVYPDATFVECSYSQLAQLLKHYYDPDVFLITVDINWTSEQIDKIKSTYNRVLIIDHHKTFDYAYAQSLVTNKFEVVHDVHHSAVWLTWDWFFPHETVPLLVSYIEDRDLWLWRLNNSKEINYVINSTPFVFAEYDKLNEYLTDYTDLIIDQGKSIERYEQQLVKSLIVPPMLQIKHQCLIPLINAPRMLSSVIGHQLLTEHKFMIAGTFHITDAGVTVSLRSKDDSAGEIAKSLGGGGHAKAAGFTCTWEQFKEMITHE